MTLHQHGRHGRRRRAPIPADAPEEMNAIQAISA
jgi:hypothetical protein